MPTRLTTGKHVTRAVPSQAHDARKRGELVINIIGTGKGAVLELRPLGRRKCVSVTVDSVYDYAVKLEVEHQRREKAKARKERKRNRLLPA